MISNISVKKAPSRHTDAANYTSPYTCSHRWLAKVQQTNDSVNHHYVVILNV